MNKKLLVVLPVCLLGFHGTSPVTAQNCLPMEPPPPEQCQNARQININNNSKKISPPNLCAKPGETIKVKVTPAGTTASIDGKGGGWPSGSGTSFTITAPDEGSYDYNVTFQDDSCIDPRIVVRD